MTSAVKTYTDLIALFIGGSIDAAEFSARYLETFKKETAPLSEPAFEALDALFGDADAFTMDSELLANRPGYYLDAAALKQCAAKAAARLTRSARQ